LFFFLRKQFDGCLCFAEYCERYAKAEDAGNHPEEDSSDGDMSDEEHTSSDEEMAGHADP
jgi:hypothetical protein